MATKRSTGKVASKPKSAPEKKKARAATAEKAPVGAKTRTANKKAARKKPAAKTRPATKKAAKKKAASSTRAANTKAAAKKTASSTRATNTKAAAKKNASNTRAANTKAATNKPTSKAHATPKKAPAKARAVPATKKGATRARGATNRTPTPAAAKVLPRGASVAPTSSPAMRGKKPKKVAKPSSASLYERLAAWVSLFGKRNDLRFLQGPTLDGSEPAPRPMPADMADLARHTSFVSLAYELPAPRPVPTRGDPDGHLFLSLKGYPTSVYLDVPSKGTFTSALELDCDTYGSGVAAFYVASAAEPFVAWDVDEPTLFRSLEDYLTTGARRGFCHSARGGAWPKNPKAAQPLFERSMPTSTPISVIRDALIAKGATTETAAALVDWLGRDCVLLLEK